jgi:PST family polysaccharide transporter
LLPRFLKKIWLNPEHRTVITNTASLSGLQVANTLLPLITIPYVVRVIGPANYGTIAFAQSFVTYFVLLVNYGFDLSASREIARVREDAQKLADVFWSVLWTKVFLFLVSSAVFAVAVVFVPQLRSEWEVMIASYLILIGSVAFPTWLFQGVEKLGLTAIFNFPLKLIFTAGILIFLRTRDQYILVPLLSSGGQVVGGLLALVYGVRNLVVGGVRWPKWGLTISRIKQGWAVFTSTVFVNFYGASNTVLLGFFASQQQVGYFASASKIVGGISALFFTPVSQALYPHVGKVIAQSSERAEEILRKLLFIISIIGIPASTTLFLGAPIVTWVMLGDQFKATVIPLRILSALPFVTAVANVLAVQGALNMKMDRSYLKVVMFGSAVNLSLNLLLDWRFAEVGGAISWLVTEMYITTAFFVLMKNHGIKVFDLQFYSSWLLPSTLSSKSKWKR